MDKQRWHEWYNALRSTGCVTTMAMQYRRVIGRLCAFYPGREPWELTTAELEAFVLRPRSRGKGLPATIKREQAIIRGFLNHPLRRGDREPEVTRVPAGLSNPVPREWIEDALAQPISPP